MNKEVWVVATDNLTDDDDVANTFTVSAKVVEPEADRQVITAHPDQSDVTVNDDDTSAGAAAVSLWSQPPVGST